MTSADHSPKKSSNNFLKPPISPSLVTRCISDSSEPDQPQRGLGGGFISRLSFRSKKHDRHQNKSEHMPKSPALSRKAFGICKFIRYAFYFAIFSYLSEFSSPFPLLDGLVRRRTPSETEKFQRGRFANTIAHYLN